MQIKKKKDYLIVSVRVLWLPNTGKLVLISSLAEPVMRASAIFILGLVSAALVPRVTPKDDQRSLLIKALIAKAAADLVFLYNNFLRLSS